MRETGTGQQVAQLHDRLMMMMIIIVLFLRHVRIDHFFNDHLTYVCTILH